MYWLITYSQTEKGKEISATTATDTPPGKWFADLYEKHHTITNKLLFAIAITKEDYKRFEGEL